MFDFDDSVSVFVLFNVDDDNVGFNSVDINVDDGDVLDLILFDLHGDDLEFNSVEINVADELDLLMFDEKNEIVDAMVP